MRLSSGLAALLACLWFVPPRASSDTPMIEVDFSKLGRPIRALHGVNKGPLAAGGLVDVSSGHKLLALPYIRLHDCHWPNPDVVDIHAVFPDMRADPEREESYDFQLTDEYIAAARGTGAQIIFRLGESIEHTSVKRHVHPPADPQKWARIAEGIVRHYNHGWANGHRWGIRYWEIWNEPDNRPSCWTGTDEDYFTLYAETSRRLKAAFPDLKVGGPGAGNTGRLAGGKLKPPAFVTAFLEYCRREKLPLDFYSWHCYTNDPAELKKRALEVRRLLDREGFARTESHLNEWNYLPDGDWSGLSRTATPEVRQRFYERMSGAEGGAFVAASLLALQDAPVDASCLFHGETGGFGLYNEHGVPNKVWRAVRLFSELAGPGRSASISGVPAGVYAAAVHRNELDTMILLVKPSSGMEAVRLRVKGLKVASCEIAVLDETRNTEFIARDASLENGSIRLHIPGPCVVLVRPQ